MEITSNRVEFNNAKLPVLHKKSFKQGHAFKNFETKDIKLTQIANDTKKNELPSSSNRWTTRQSIDALTVTAYAAIVMTAIAIKTCRTTMVKDVEKLIKTKKTNRVQKKEIEYAADVMQGKYDKGSMMYRLFDYFGKLKEDSAELTNNLVYGFGTLVVMPLVILFSPFGKKKATKEDRAFTVVRQPVSFATVFIMQLTFDKIFKSLIKEMNKYQLLDGIKSKGKELYFSSKRMKTVISETLASKGKKPFYYFDKDSLFGKKPHKDALEVLNFHLFGEKTEFIAHGGLGRQAIEFKPGGNKFTLDEFSHSIVSVIEKIGEKKPTLEQINGLKKLVSHYIEMAPELGTQIENMASSGARGRALKESSAIIANSIASQALGIMMLNFVYGKMMKKYGQLKQKNQNPIPVNGGQK